MSRTPYLDLNIPDKSSKGFVVTDVFEPNFTKLDQEAERVNLRKMSTEDNIEELKKATRYKVGDVVEVLGYYVKGDRANHKRKKMPVGYNGADTVIGNDGSIWSVVHSGEVDVTWFGAKGDDTFDNHDIIQRCLDMYDVVLLPSNNKFAITKMLKMNGAKELRLGMNTQLNKWSRGADSNPALHITGSGFKLSGNSMQESSIWCGDASNYLGAVCVGHLGITDLVPNETLRGTIRDLHIVGTTKKDYFTSSLTLCGLELEGKANYFHTIDNVMCTGSDIGILLWGWANGNNMSNLHFTSVSNALYYKVVPSGVAGGQRDRVPLDNNVVNLFHNHSPRGVTLNLEDSQTNMFTNINCEQDMENGTSIYAHKPIFENTFILSSLVKNRTIPNENDGSNTIIDTRFDSIVANLKIGQTNKSESESFLKFKEDGFYFMSGVVEMSGTTSVALSESFDYAYSNVSSYVPETIPPVFNSYVRGNVLTINPGDSIQRKVSYFVFGYKLNITKMVARLDTPYHANNMHKLGILDSYHNYLTKLHEYEKQKNIQSNTSVVNLNVIQPPIIPTEVEEYAKEYNLI